VSGSPALRLALLALAGTAAACASRAPLSVQRFVLEVPATPLSPPGADSRVLALRPVRINPAFVEPSLVYRTRGETAEVDPYASLAGPPRSLLNDAIRAWLLREPGVKDVVAGLAGPSGLTVEVLVAEMSGDFRTPGAPVGALDLEIAVYAGDPAPGAAPLFRKLYARRAPLGERSAAAVVAAWSRALGSIVKELGTDLAVVVAPG
jgi:uncharacterized lipoprotein YmbA